MTELWQLYDETGNVLQGKGGTKDEIYAGALHGAAHVWIWRKQNNDIEVLLQKRAADKRTWPDYWDISAAGHIDVDEEPIHAAIRETKEEIGLEVAAKDLVLIAKRRDQLLAPGGAVENEYRWIYALRLEAADDFVLQEEEVELLAWKSFETVRAEVMDENQLERYVPQGSAYFKQVFDFIEVLARSE